MNPKTDNNESDRLDHALHGDDARHLAYGQLADEIQRVLKAGQQPDAQSLQEKYPQLASEIPQLIPALAMLEEIGIEPTGSADRMDSAGVALGDFRIIREIGRGGMGVVYEAEQISMSRHVALKVLPFASVLDKKMLHRFRSESQIAGQLIHQNIVPVHAVGAERGVHYYAMQYIDGRTLAEFISELKAASSAVPGAGVRDRDAGTSNEASIDKPTDLRHDLRSRISESDTSLVAVLSTAQSCADAAYVRSAAELGVQVAMALDYAHEEGVIHRDIKPSNLMVDGKGKIWITDFGLAHVESGPSITMTGDFLGTLRYMSPEQTLAQRVIVDHRTDIYSLGLTLYELLTQQPALIGSNRQELLRQIAFDDPIRPRRLNKSIPIDLETILLKAIEKNPGDRYATAGELAEDLRRFVDNRPIHARRPTITQHTAKWCRRHAFPVVTLAVSLLVLVCIIAGAALVMAGKERAARQDVENANRQAEADREHAQLVAEFLTETFKSIDPGDSFNMRRMLDDAAQRIDEGIFANHPLVEASLRDTLGDAYVDFARSELAVRQLKPALDIRQRLLGHEHPETLATALELAQAYKDLKDEQQAMRLAREVVDARRRHLGDEHVDTIESIGVLAACHTRFGKIAESERLYREAVHLSETVLGPNTQEMSRTLSHLAWVLHIKGEYVEPIQLVRRAYQLAQEHHGASHPSTVFEMDRLGFLLYEHAQQDVEAFRHELLEAEELSRQALELRIRFGRPHGSARYNLARIKRTLGKLDEAESEFTEMIENQIAKQGADTPGQAGMLMELAIVQDLKGEPDRALESVQEAQRIYRKVFGNDHYQVGATLRELGRILTKQGRFAEAETALLESYAIVMRAFGEQEETTRRTVSELIRLFELQDVSEQVKHWRTVMEQSASSSEIKTTNVDGL